MANSRLIVMGPPGAGKGTQSQRIAEEFDLEHVETGDILRSNKDMETEHGTPREYMEKGEYVPDEVVNAIVEEELSDADGFVLDGYPRTKVQVEFLDEITEIDLVLYLAVSEETLVERLTNRRVCADCGSRYHLRFDPPEEEGTCEECGGELIQREDDKPEPIRTRIREYEDKTADLLDFYRSRDLLTEIDGEQPPDEVWADIEHEIEGS